MDDPLETIMKWAAVYLAPVIVAYGRGHHNRHAIAALDVLLGWTVIGWIASLVWAFTHVKTEPTT